MHLFIGVIVLLMLPGSVAAAERQASVMDDVTGPVLQGLMQEWGYRAQLTYDDSGDPQISSHTSGIKFYVDFYECDDENDRACRSLHLISGLDMEEPLDPEIVRVWNEERRYGSAYLDDEGDPYIQMSINIEGGLTSEALRHNFEWWEVAAGGFADHVDW